MAVKWEKNSIWRSLEEIKFFEHPYAPVVMGNS